MTTPEPSPVKKSFTTELTPEAKAKRICILYSVEPIERQWWIVSPSGKRWAGAFHAEVIANHMLEEYSQMLAKPLTGHSIECEDVYPALTTDFLLRVARENGIGLSSLTNVTIDERRKYELIENQRNYVCALIADGRQITKEADTPTEALYLALLRFRGEEK